MIDKRLMKRMRSDNPLAAGAFVIVDGQFGSTGKGLIASVLANCFIDYSVTVFSNAGPNSGHTFYTNDMEKVVLQQLPSWAVALHRAGGDAVVVMNAGAVIDEERLVYEVEKYKVRTYVHEHAAVVSQNSTDMEKNLKEAIGSTGKGTGAAIAAKVMRDIGAVYSSAKPKYIPRLLSPCNQRMVHGAIEMAQNTVVEVSQGYSLGLNSGFYPYCTSRECTVAQALSDAGMHPHDLGKTLMTLRTFPIRVGGNSGPGYSDQTEIAWEDIGVEPELTTVTKKKRRIFTWSDEQYVEALRANRPDYLFINFMNYLPEAIHEKFILNKKKIYRRVMGHHPDGILLGYGPYNNNVKLWEPSV